MKKLLVVMALLNLWPTLALAQVPLPGLDRLQAYSIYDPKGQQIIEGKNLDEVRPLASLTKLVTTYVLLQHEPRWTKRVTMKKTDDIMGTRQFVRPGGIYTIRELWRAGLIASANNAIKTMIRGLGLKESDVVAEMNATAQGLGLTQTKFVDVTGLSPQNVSTAREFHSLISLALSQKEIYDTLKMRVVNIGSGKYWRHVTTTNLVLGKDFVRAGKTGFIDESGYNFAASLENDGLNYQLLILGAPTRGESFVEARSLARWVYGLGDFSQNISSILGPMSKIPSSVGGGL